MSEIDKKRKVIAKILKQYRINKKLTQRELANKLGLNESDISKIESGTRNFTINRLIEISNVLEFEIINKYSKK